MAIKILDIEEVIEENGLKILAYADSGAGKTRSLATINTPTIVLSAEAGLLSLKKAIKENPKLKKLLRVIKIESLEDLREALIMFQESDVRLCNWIALDSISEIAEQVLKAEKDINSDKRQAYGALSETTIGILREFRDLPFYNVYMTAKMERGEDSEGRNFFMPMFPGKGIAKNIPYMFDEVFVLQNEELDEYDENGAPVIQRYFQTAKDSRFIAKDRSGELNTFEKVDLSRIYKKIRGAEEISFELDEETAAKYSAKISLIHQNSNENDDESITADCDTFWFHYEKEKWLKAEAGADLSDMIELKEAGEVAQVTAAEFKAKKLNSDGGEEEPESEIKKTAHGESEIAAEVRYWLHTPSDQVMRTEIGDDVADMLSNGEVDEITKKVFVKLGGNDNPPSDDEEEPQGDAVIQEDETKYWSDESGKVFETAEGDDITEFVNDPATYEEINKRMYERLAYAQNNTDEAEEVEAEEVEEEILGAKKQYWKHTGMGSCMATEKGDNIIAMLNNQEVEEIRRADFEEWEAEQAEEEREPEPEIQRRPAAGGLTRVQRALKEQEEANAKK